MDASAPLIDEINQSRRGAVILCGGGSRRMGCDKASLPIGDETMLGRMMRLVAKAAPREQIVLVAAANQRLPSLPWEATVVHDRLPDQGPLPAIADGLAALPASVAAALVVACDAPLLEPSVVDLLFAALPADADAIVPVDGERFHPLTAVYRPSCAASLQANFDAGRLSLHAALRSGTFRLAKLPVERLCMADPQLHSLINCNTPAEYNAVLAALAQPAANLARETDGHQGQSTKP